MVIKIDDYNFYVTSFPNSICRSLRRTLVQQQFWSTNKKTPDLFGVFIYKEGKD